MNTLNQGWGLPIPTLPIRNIVIPANKTACPTGCVVGGSIKVDWIPAKKSQECQSQMTEYLHPGLASPWLNPVPRLKPQAGKFIKILRTIPKLYIGVKFYDDFKKAESDKI